MSQDSNIVSVRYMIDDVDAAVAFYTNHLGFRLEKDASPAFASVVRGNLRLLLSGEKSSGRQPLGDGTKPVPGGWNRIHLEVSDISAESRATSCCGCEIPPRGDRYPRQSKCVRSLQLPEPGKAASPTMIA